MLSEAQERKKHMNILIVVKYFLENNGPSIEEVSQATDIPSSSVQRYLNDPLVTQLCQELGFSDPHKEIQTLLQRNKENGLKKGGTNYAMNNVPTKDELGKFKGSRKK